MLESIFVDITEHDRSWMKSKSVLKPLEAYRALLKKEARSPAPAHRQRLEILSRGFKAIIDEMEQSLWAAIQFASHVQSDTENAMTPVELKDYHRFIYFQKNTYIRLFSALDKLGYFLNERYLLQVEKVKHRFSYYTVLRVMQQRKVDPELLSDLLWLRNEYAETMNELRKKRNTEIHLIDPHLLEELMNQARKRHPNEPYRLPNINEEIHSLRKGYDMVMKSIEKVFVHQTYA
jgi:hypothetical protein